MYRILALAPSPSQLPGRHWDPNRRPDIDANHAGALIFLVVFGVVAYLLYQRAKRNPNNDGW